MTEPEETKKGLLDELLQLPGVGLDLADKLVRSGIKGARDISTRSVEEVSKLAGVTKDNARDIISIATRVADRTTGAVFETARGLTGATGEAMGATLKELASLPGIGLERAEKLMRAGIRDVGDLAGRSVEELGKVADFTEETARTVIAAAADLSRSLTGTATVVAGRTFEELQAAATTLQERLGKILSPEQIMGLVAAGYDNLEKLAAASIEQLAKVQSMTADAIDRLRSLFKDD